MQRRNPRKRRLEIHPTVFWGSAALILLFVALSLIFLKQADAFFETTQDLIVSKLGWLYVFSVNVFLLFVIYLLFSRYGKIRIGGANAKPEFTYFGWIAMLFSAGMGIGLVFYGVAEPVLHYTQPPVGEPGTSAAADHSMSLTMLHWGLHCWAVYGLVGLALGFFAYNRGLPLTIRSAFHPLMGERIHGAWGDTVDILAAMATLFGLATSLGLGVQQINAGLTHLFGVPESTMAQVVLIAVITSFATISVVLGVDRGIRRLSILNMWVAFGLLLFVLILGPTLHVLGAMVANFGDYAVKLPTLGTWTTLTYETDWKKEWTLFFWGWWIAWSPFVGMFIARVSFGRTVREFLINVVLLPTLLTIVWLSVFGNTSLYVELFGSGGIAEAVDQNIAVALFVLLEQFPLSFLTCLLGVVVVVIFFVSSSDSASLVVDIITAGGNTNPPVRQRVFWASMEGVVAAVLLLGGGLHALQAAALTSGLPFAFVLLLMTISLYLGLREEWKRTNDQP